jgi:hypothetical protein
MTAREALLHDPFISLATAGTLLPGERPGVGVSTSTIYRWGTEGLTLPDGRVVKLAIWRLGRKWVTTRGALADFIEAQQPGIGATPPPATTPAGHVNPANAG